MKSTTRQENQALEKLYMSMFTEQDDAPKPLASAARVLRTREEEEEAGKDPKEAPKEIKTIRKQAEDLVDIQSKELDKAAKELDKQSKEI